MAYQNFKTNCALFFSYRWFKFSETGRKAPVELGERIKQVGGTLIIREAKVEDSGKYLCVVNNSVGGESVETVLTVTGESLLLACRYFSFIIMSITVSIAVRIRLFSIH